MSAPTTATTPAPAAKATAGEILGKGLAILLIAYLAGEAVNALLSGLGMGLGNFAIRAANGANAMDAVFRMMFKMSLGLSTFALVYLAFKSVSLLKEALTPPATAPNP